ncbi:calcium-binding protein [Nocardioides sp.]|uniref:calcium-binding protein n=1 Tax=Nocardioides sp. TaxID=35761 RepID=UPI002CC38914|nr:calcium-binding protein [Nocardioides sp.]HXH80319.1 calcium-binding protein [Nocardioides sp.]
MSYRSALATTTLLTAALLTPAPASAVGETCQGRPATIVGTGAEVRGTSGDDVVVTGASRKADAGAGDDLICVTATDQDRRIYVSAGPGNDSVDASATTAYSTTTDLGDGLDRYVGGVGGGFLYVQANGADDHVQDTFVTTLSITEPPTGSVGSYTGGYLVVVSATLGIDVDLDGQLVVGGTAAAVMGGYTDADVFAPEVVLRGNAHRNSLGARGCDVRIYGEGGHDYLQSRAQGGDGEPTFDCNSATQLLGGAGNDELYGWHGKDRLVGNAGRDRLVGGDESDVLLGGSGDDILEGESGRDVLRGNGGSDYLTGGKGRDALRGDAGRDMASGDKGRDRCVAETERHCES